MPIIKSAKKRVKVASKATVRNSKTKRSLKSAVKAFHKSLNGDKKNAEQLARKAQSEIAKAGKKHVMHKNKVARKQRQLSKAAKAAGVSVSAGTKKATSKAPTTKKTVTKTTVAKKTTVKKPVR